MMETKRIKVKSIFPIRERNWLYTEIDSLEWDYSKFGKINLCFNDEKIMMYYDAFSNINGKPVLRLIPKDSQFQTVSEITEKVKDYSTSIYIERCYDL